MSSGSRVQYSPQIPDIRERVVFGRKDLDYLVASKLGPSTYYGQFHNLRARHNAKTPHNDHQCIRRNKMY